MEKSGKSLYTIKKDVRCLACKSKGAVKYYGEYFKDGVGELADDIKAYEEVRNKPYLSPAMGFGGTIPYSCLNCDNQGLIDYGGLEGYSQAFETIQKEEGNEN